MALRLLQSSRGMKTLASGAYKKTPESAQKVMDTFAKYKACAVLRTPKAEQCAPAMQAAIDGGFDIVEFTLTTPGCLDQVANFRKKLDGKVMVGCGTVMDIPDAKAAMDAGAEFLVAPCLVPEVVTWCALNNIVIIPGCQTPSEAYEAYRAGAPVQKIFPGVAGGAAWVKGVDLDNAGDFLKNGANSIGLVAPLFPADAVAAGNWDVINANAVKVIGNVKAAIA